MKVTTISKLSIWKRSIFARLFLTFLVVMIPIYFIGISIYIWGIGTVKEQISSSKAAQINAYIDNFEKEIQRIKTQQSDCLLGDDLNRLANSHEYMNDYEKGYFMLKLQQRLNAVNNSSIYVKNAVAIIPSIKKRVPGVGSISGLREEDYEMLMINDNSTPSQIAYVNNRLYLNAIFPSNYILESRMPLYSIIVELSSDEIRKALSQFNYNNGSGTILLSSERDFDLASGENTDSIKFIKNYAREQLQKSGESNTPVRIDDRNYQCMR